MFHTVFVLLKQSFIGRTLLLVTKLSVFKGNIIERIDSSLSILEGLSRSYVVNFLLEESYSVNQNKIINTCDDCDGFATSSSIGNSFI